MRQGAAAACLVFAALGGSTAQAGGGAPSVGGYTYYNRPGADLAAHERDVRDCVIVAGRIRSPSEEEAAQPWSPSLFASNSEARIYASAGLESCMVVRGWRVVALTEAEGQPLAALPAEDLARRLAPWIGAAEPHGVVVRAWNNDAVRGGARFLNLPGPKRKGQLSLLAVSPELKKLPSAPMPPPPSPWINPRWPAKPLKPADLAALRPDAAVLMVEVRNPNGHAGYGLAFNRMGADKDSFPSTTDHATDRIAPVVVSFYNTRRFEMFAYAVPAGRWRISALGPEPTMNLCLGSPSFEVKAGEVVYAGAFDMVAEDLGPDLDLSPAQAWLGAQGRPLRAASYVNGSQGWCGDNGVYALEFKSAPFEPGYGWGSKAASQ